MVTPPWQSFDDELSRWRDAGRVADFWWRDDDAKLPTPALVRLATLAVESRVPLGLAVVPAGADPAIEVWLNWQTVTAGRHRGRSSGAVFLFGGNA